MKLWDSEGNEFTIMGGVKDGLTLRGEAGDKEISIHDLQYYRGCPPEQWEAMEQLQTAIKNGDITIEEIRKHKEKLINVVIITDNYKVKWSIYHETGGIIEHGFWSEKAAVSYAKEHYMVRVDTFLEVPK